MLRRCIRCFLLPVFLLTAVCNKSVDTGAPETSASGTWHYSIQPLLNIITDTLNIWLKIDNDQSYSLELIERSDKLLYSSKGTWEATDDSIYLTGRDCLILDTSTDPDSIVSLDDTICEKPIPLNLPSKPDLWKIETTNLTPMLSAFPIQLDTSVITVFFPEIPLKKQGD